MKGYIHIESMTHDGHTGFSVKTHAQDVDTMDVIQVLDSVCQALHVSNKLLEVFVTLRGVGILDTIRSVTPIEGSEISFDVEEIIRQIKRGKNNEG